ncbi:MAG: hypothetical protein ACI8QS_001647 [Planctomycetota bacterium]|jgi:hypothetical protein
MSKKELEVTCPCCESRLSIDRLTSKVMRARRPEELDASGKPKVSDADWDQISARVKGRLGSAKSKFDDGLGKERSKVRDLDALFDERKKKLGGAASEEDQGGL